MSAWRMLVSAAVGSIALVAAVVLAAPGLAGRIALAEWGQAVAEASAAVACAVAAAHTRGRARAVWGLFATGQAIWAVTDGTAGVLLASGHVVPEVSPLEIGWLGFYVPMLAAVLLLYRRLRPERGWQGLLDGMIVTVAVAAVAWTTVLAPLAEDASGGLVGALVALLYPALDLVCLMALGWIVLRHGRRSPPWLRWVVAAFAMQSAAGLAYAVSALHGHELTLAPALVFMAAGWTWVAAGIVRTRAAERAWAAGRHDAPPAWSQTAPFVLGAGVVTLGAARPDPELRIAAVVAAALVAARAVDAMRVARGLLAERDLLLVTDPLTGVFNRRYLDHEANRSFARAERGDESLSAIALDLDNFKAVNDRLGHGVGDDVLVAVARTIGAELRAGDLVCRLGGDEFLVLCPGTATPEALRVAERIRARVRARAAALVPEIPVTASLGVATVPGDAPDGPGLLRAADEALYAAKAAGRDMSVAHATGVGAPA
jgi:two-component system, cell cycle response regulator